MIKKQQKNHEKFFVETADHLLMSNWAVVDPENEEEWPDFLIEENNIRFGLEVRDIFPDERKKGGSTKKSQEASNRGILERIISNYYDYHPTVPLSVQLIGNIHDVDVDVDVIVQSLIEASTKLGILEHTRVEAYRGCILYIRKLPEGLGFKRYDRWKYVTDRVGFSQLLSESFLQLDSEVFVRTSTEIDFLLDIKLPFYRPYPFYI